MRLTSPRFNWNARLQLAANNSPPAKRGDKGLHVRHIQQALIDLGVTWQLILRMRRQ
jgi:hypothetical protein